MSAPSFFDSHCHLDFPQFNDDRDEVLRRMQEEGVDRCVSVAVDFEHLPRLQSLAEQHDNIWFSVGIHPNHEVDEEPTVEQLCALSNHPKCVAVGETGMDFYRHRVDPALQEARFRTHIRAARQLGKPVIVHNRDADNESIRILTEAEIGKCGGIMHCFSAGWDTARAALDLGMYISFSGNVTFKRNDELREVARQVPMDRLLIETDAPYLAPMPHRGKRNEPAYVKHVARCIADVKGLSIREMAEASTSNALKVFGI
ncbi:MAG: TatD family hydrolase [Mariprofundaceae bacterium]|nr:TatD family hydrolase [Mariprofundaceae bacterium]